MADPTPSTDARPDADNHPTTELAAPPTAVRNLVRSARNAAGAALPLAAPVGGPRSGTAETARAIGERLWARTGSPTQAALRGLLTRQLPHYYAPSVLEPVDAYLLDVMGGSRLFLQSACAGAGSSFLAMDYARAFNEDAEARNARERVFYVRIEPETRSVAQFYDTVCLATGAPLTYQEIRHRSPAYFALRFLAAVISKGAQAIVFDHVRELSPRVRACIASMLRITDPDYAVEREHQQAFAAVHGRIGVAIVDRLPPEVLFRTSPDVLLLLQNRHHVLYPYRELDDIAEAIRQADIGLDDFDMSNPDDAEIAWVVRERTSGLPVQMTSLFQLIDKVARLSGGIRPTPGVVEMALPFYRNLVDVVWASAAADPSAADPARGRAYGVYPADVVRLPEKLSPAQRRKLTALAANEFARPNARASEDDCDDAGEECTGKGAADRTVAMKTARSAMLKKRRESRHLATSEGAAMRRKGHVNIDFGEKDTP